MALEEILTPAFLIGLGAATFRVTTPLIIGALGQLYEQRSGVLDLTDEGIMVMGAFTAFVLAYFTGNLWGGMLLGAVTGALIGWFFSYMTVELGTDQAVTGVVITLTSYGLVSYLTRAIYGGSYIQIKSQFEEVSIPYLSDIPVLGDVFFKQNIWVYIALASAPILHVVMYRTAYGLKMRAVGDNPKAADSLGINVYRTRYISVIFGTMLSGLAGAYMSLAYVPAFSENIISGRGWIIIALVYFGTWKPAYVLAGSFLFGFIEAFQLRVQAVYQGLPYQLLLMLPYLMTIVAVVAVAKRKELMPAALCVHYKREAG